MLDGEDEEKVFQLEPDRNKHNNQKEKKRNTWNLRKNKGNYIRGIRVYQPLLPLNI